MPETLKEIAQKLIDSEKKVQLIYAFNGAGKTRLSREVVNLVNADNEGANEEIDASERRILYYNAFTEDLFYWDNDLEKNVDRKLNIQPNQFTSWVFKDQGQDQNIMGHFQRYTDNRLTPQISSDYSHITFSLLGGSDNNTHYIKVSKGEESNYIWCVFYSLLDQLIDVLSETEIDNRETDVFNNLEYIFIDDPVSSLDDNHLIQLAIDIARLTKSSPSGLKFIITTHNPLFFNVLSNEIKKAKKFILRRKNGDIHALESQPNDSPFAYHLYLKKEIENAIEQNQETKIHYNHLRNILEKTATYLGYSRWPDLLAVLVEDNDVNPYTKRVTNLYSHSQHAGEEIAILDDNEKRTLKYIMKRIDTILKFYKHPEKR